MGSQLPYLRMCENRGWGVIVMNTNMNVTDGSSNDPLPVGFLLLLLDRVSADGIKLTIPVVNAFQRI